MGCAGSKVVLTETENKAKIKVINKFKEMKNNKNDKKEDSKDKIDKYKKDIDQSKEKYKMNDDDLKSINSSDSSN
jgi:uncharacterized protein (UPF0305 family)